MKKLIEFIKAFVRGEEAEIEIALEWYDLVTIALAIGLIVTWLVKL
ncbi:hypothetical protein [Olivibacter sitiensis]|nr:hypothetical protein [Olivibacter sitiensis]